MTKSKIQIPKYQHVLLCVCIIMVSLFVSLQAWGDSPQPINPDPISNNDPVKELLDRVKQQTGYAVELVGDIPELQAAETLDDIVFPEDIDQLARYLGISSHAAKIDFEAKTIRLLVVRTLPRESMNAVETNQRSMERLPLQDPSLTSAEEEVVVSFYEQLQDTLPEINTSITEEDEQEVREGVLLDEPYLTPVEAKGVVSFYNRLQRSIPKINTAITEADELNVMSAVSSDQPYLTAAEGEEVLSFYNRQMRGLPKTVTLDAPDNGSGPNGKGGRSVKDEIE